METTQRKLDAALIAEAVAWLLANDPPPPKLPKLHRAIDIPALEAIEAIRQAAGLRRAKAWPRRFARYGRPTRLAVG